MFTAEIKRLSNTVASIEAQINRSLDSHGCVICDASRLVTQRRRVLKALSVLKNLSALEDRDDAFQS